MQTCVTFQLGAREHYAVPRMLDSIGRLKALVSDAWAPPESVWARLPGGTGRRLRERFHDALPTDRVASLTAELIAFEASQRVTSAPTFWHACMIRNAWFERRAVAIARRQGLFDEKPIVAAYSYAALGILKAAKQQGCRTVLMQIDPAIIEDRIVRREFERWHRATGVKAAWSPPPAAYWRRWIEETQVADRILVNSSWSQEALELVGVAPDKIRVVPLAYEPPRDALAHRRDYPSTFTNERPLRILFLGSLVLRKGIARVLDAVRSLRGEPVVFRFVGTPEVELPADLADAPEVEWLGPVPRGDVHGHYRWADVFLFPTLSDGFGLTQIEAAAWGLPLIASRRCGEVLTDGQHGLQLCRATGQAIESAIRTILCREVDLKSMSEAARARAGDFRLSRIAQILSEAVSD